MSKRLLAIDLVLLAGAWVLGDRARDNWMEAKKRERLTLGRTIAPAPAPKYTPPPAPPRATAADYGDVAQLMLFSADRNPTVVVEVAPAKPMPALPLLYGVFNLGEGPVAIMTPKQGERQREVKPGEAIGEFTLVSVTPEEIVLDWEGQRVAKKTQDFVARPAQAEVASTAAAGKAGRTPVQQLAAPVVEQALGPGADMGGGERVCQRGDSSPPGTVRDGYRKVVNATPFGQACRWVAVK